MTKPDALADVPDSVAVPLMALIRAVEAWRDDGDPEACLCFEAPPWVFGKRNNVWCGNCQKRFNMQTGV